MVAKEIVAEAAMEKAKVALPDKPVETPAAEPALVEAPAAEQPKQTRSRRATSAKKSAPEATVVEQSKPTRERKNKSEKESFKTWRAVFQG